MSALRLRQHSFLGAIAHDHYTAVGKIVARAVGAEPEPLSEPGLGRLEGILEGSSPALVFLCGLPYTRLRDRDLPVEPIAAPVPRGADGPVYSSALVVRSELGERSAAELGGCLFGYNGGDSLSGWVLPRSGFPESLFERTTPTGSHRRSVELLLAGEIDAAAIDSILLALEARADPHVAALPVIAHAGPAPSPPVVLANGSRALADAARRALRGLADTDAGRAALELGDVDRYVAVDDADYDPVRELDRTTEPPPRSDA
jgi:ABC-type phosphate/phosphonate transport system substrate-binding protein